MRVNKKARQPIQSWTPRNDQIALLSFSGQHSRPEIAKIAGVSVSLVEKILADPRAEEIIEVARKALREKLLSDMESQLDMASKASIQVIRKTLDADISPYHKAKPNQDRVALKMLAGRGFLKTEVTSTSSGFLVSPEQFDRLEGALRKADAAQQINPFGTAIAVIDAEVLDD